MSLRLMLAAAGSLAVVVVLTGGAQAGNQSTARAAPSSATTHAGGGGSQRLSPRSWSVYVRTRTKARKINSAALKTWSKCSVIASRGASSSSIQSCLGNSLSTVVTQGKKVLAVLQGLGKGVTGACASSLAKLQGYTKLYLAGVNALQTNLAGKGVGGGVGFDTQLDNARHALTRARATEPPVEAACKPK